MCSIGVYQSTFIDATPAFRCKLPMLTTDTYEVQTKEHDRLVNLYIPYDYVKNTYEKCKIFIEGTNQTKICESWVYSKEFYGETIVTKWNLVCGNMPISPRGVQIVFFLGNMIGVLLIGPFSDWYGRKTGLLTALTIWFAL